MSLHNRQLQIEPSWKHYLAAEFEKGYMQQLREFLLTEKKHGKIIFPPGKDIFNAFWYTPFANVKVVILGQDPYHGLNQAHGLCFSVKPGVVPPPSLINIFTELKSDLDIVQPPHGCLIPWARQGVLLLNSVLTVECGKAGSHQHRGWEIFTDSVVAILNEQCEHLVFLLWGSYAWKKGAHLDEKKHAVLRSAHPSPLSAYRGFFGSKHFSKTNEYLQRYGKKPIDWQLPPAECIELSYQAVTEVD